MAKAVIINAGRYAKEACNHKIERNNNDALGSWGSGGVDDKQIQTRQFCHL